MQPQVNQTNGVVDREPLRLDAEGQPVVAEWDESDPPPPPKSKELVTLSEQFTPDPAKVKALDKATEYELMRMAGVTPIVSTSEAAEYFNRTTQWIYWGLTKDEKGEQVFVWPDGSPIEPERVGSNRRFTMEILTAILQACHRRGNIDPQELQTIIRRIKYTELGVEWRARETPRWHYVDLGRNRHRWVRPSDCYFDRRNKVWRLRTSERPKKRSRRPEPPVVEPDYIDAEIVEMGTGQ